VGGRGKSNGVFAFSLSRPWEREQERWGLFPFAIFSFYLFLSPYCKFEKLYNNKTLHTWNAFLRSFEQ
jgi:hypothetical protein